jgi:hypothetical protein
MKVVADAFSVFIRGIMRDSASLSNTVEGPSVLVRCYWRSGCTQLDSLAHFSHCDSERFDLFLLLRNYRFLFPQPTLLILYFPVLFSGTP